jgi:hypothetical protein
MCDGEYLIPVVLYLPDPVGNPNLKGIVYAVEKNDERVKQPLRVRKPYVGDDSALLPGEEN